MGPWLERGWYYGGSSQQLNTIQSSLYIPLSSFLFAARIFLDETSNIAFGQGNQSIEHSAVASAHEAVGKSVSQSYRWPVRLVVVDDFDYDLADYHKLRRLQNTHQNSQEPSEEKVVGQELRKGTWQEDPSVRQIGRRLQRRYSKGTLAVRRRTNRLSHVQTELTRSGRC